MDKTYILGQDPEDERLILLSSESISVNNSMYQKLITSYE